MAYEKNDPESKQDVSLEKRRAALQDQENGLDPQQVADNSKYQPDKRQRAIRRQVYARYYQMRDDSLRKEAEADWEIADKEYGMVVAEREPDDWQSHLQLPDAFAAIQAQAQETIERKSRPSLTATEDSDEPIEQFANAVMNYNMSNTGYDYQYALAKLAASIRGTAFLMDYWRTEKRVVKDPVSVAADGTIEYEEKVIVDFDDDYTEWVPNEFIYIDEKAKHVDEAGDMVYREILNIDRFHDKYGNKPGYFDVEYVVAGGDTSNKSYFKLPSDITLQEVEVLHYKNKNTDAAWCVANNVTIYDEPLPTKHKQLPVAVVYQYRVPGRFWGMGIPKVIHFLSEERKSIRNLNMDRQKMQLNKMFIHNKNFDISDDDLITRPHGLISVDANGQDVRGALSPIEYGDVPASYFRTEEILLEDIRRAHGIDDRIQGVQTGGTATEAAILKESSLKRVNLISISAEMDTVIRVGRLKWSNIQFNYGTPRLESITEGNETRDKKIYRPITVQGKKFKIVDDNGSKSLRFEDIRGNSALTLKPEFAKYMEGSFDVTVDSAIFAPVSKAIEQTKKTEIFSLLLSNPATMAILDINGATADLLQVNDIQVDKWLKNPDANRHDMQMMADAENMVMAAGQPLAGTPNATEDHTLIHLMYTKSQEFHLLPPEIQQIIMDHILQEHDNNPATGSAASLLGGAAPPPQPGLPGAGGPPPQPQVADLQATNFAAPE